MSRLRAIRKILLATNYFVLTDDQSEASISPLYADRFVDLLKRELDGLYLVRHRHNQMLNKVADAELEDSTQSPKKQEEEE